MATETRSETWVKERFRAILRFIEKRLYEYIEQTFDQYEIEQLKASAKSDFQDGYRYQILRYSWGAALNSVSINQLGPEAEEAYALLTELKDLGNYLSSGVAARAYVEKVMFPDGDDMFDEILSNTVGITVVPPKKKGGSKCKTLN